MTTTERKKWLKIAGWGFLILVGLGVGAYFFMPNFKKWVDEKWEKISAKFKKK